MWHPEQKRTIVKCCKTPDALSALLCVYNCCNMLIPARVYVGSFQVPKYDINPKMSARLLDMYVLMYIFKLVK